MAPVAMVKLKDKKATHVNPPYSSEEKVMNWDGGSGYREVGR